MTNVIIGNKKNKFLADKLKWEFWLLKEKQFPDSEIKPILPYEKKINTAILILEKENHELINDYLIKFFLVSRKLKELASKVIGVLPYLPYARQDDIFRPGEPLSSVYIAELLEYNVDTIITFNMHEHRKQISDLFSIPAYNISLFKDLALCFKNLNPEKVVLIGPDQESSQFINDFKQNFPASSYILHKTRNSLTGKVSFQEKTLPLTNKDVIIVDDIVSSGGTIKLLINLLKKAKVRNIYLAFVHAILGNKTIIELKKLGIKKVITTNTFNNDYYQVNYLDSLWHFLTANKELLK